jgi:hypothetical protein
MAWGAWAVGAVADHPRLPGCYAAAAQAAWFGGRIDEATALARRGIAVAGGPGDPAATAPLEALGDASLVSGDLAVAADAYGALAALATPGDLASRSIATGNLALARSYAGDEDGARAAAAEAAAGAVASSNPTAVAMSRFVEGEVLADVEPDRAAAALDEARALATEVGNRFVAGLALTALVALHGRHGPPERALPLFRDAIEHWRAARNRTQLVTALRNLVILLARIGRDEPAVALASAMRHAAPAPSFGVEAERIATAMAAARRRLGDEAYASAEALGDDRTVEQAADAALALLAGP